MRCYIENCNGIPKSTTSKVYVEKGEFSEEEQRYDEEFDATEYCCPNGHRFIV